MLREYLYQIGKEYLDAKKEPWAQHSLGKLIRNPKDIFSKVIDNKRIDELSFKGSSGQHNTWANIPWCAVFIKELTTGTSKGYFVVYLFDMEMTNVYLCLGQSSTEAEQIVKKYKKISLEDYLKAKAKIMQIKIPEYSKYFPENEIDLKWKNNENDSRLAKGYEYSIALSKSYKVANLPTNEILQKDLNLMINAYFDLKDRGGRDDINDIQDIYHEEKDQDLRKVNRSTVESKKYKIHKQIEREISASDIKKIKEKLGYKCEICEKGLNIKKTFHEKFGDIGKSCYDLHHKIPISSIKESKEYVHDASDFAVLCVTCHRIVHRMEDPTDFEKAREFIVSREELY